MVNHTQNLAIQVVNQALSSVNSAIRFYQVRQTTRMLISLEETLIEVKGFVEVVEKITPRATELLQEINDMLNVLQDKKPLQEINISHSLIEIK